METIKIIQIVSVLISLVAPVFFYIIIREGIKISNFETKLKLKFNGLLFFGVSFWVLTVFLLTLNNFFSYNVGESFPKFLFGLLVPVSVVILLFSRKNFRTILNNISFRYLALGQTWRILGAIFFLVATSGIGPKEFISSGIGDVTTGVIAILSVWSLSKGFSWSKISMFGLIAFGVIDLLTVLFILLNKYPIWSNAIPSTVSAGSFPMMLIIGIAAPIALLLHVFMLRKLILEERSKLIPN